MAKGEAPQEIFVIPEKLDQGCGGTKKPLGGNSLKLDTISSEWFVRVRLNWNFTLNQKKKGGGRNKN